MDAKEREEVMNIYRVRLTNGTGKQAIHRYYRVEALRIEDAITRAEDIVISKGQVEASKIKVTPLRALTTARYGRWDTRASQEARDRRALTELAQRHSEAAKEVA